MKTRLAVIVAFASLGLACACKRANSDADVESISVKKVFPGMTSRQILDLLTPVRLEIMDANEALCVMPFAVSFEEWDEKTNLTQQELREIEALAKKYSNQFVVESRKANAYRATTIARSLAAAGNVGAVAAKQAAASAEQVKIYTQATRPLVEKSLENTKSLQLLLAEVQSKHGFSVAHQVVKRLVPKLASVEKNTWFMVDKAKEATQSATEHLESVSGVAKAIEKTAPFLSASLTVLGSAASAFSNSLLACDLSNGVLAQIELWELEAIHADSTVRAEKKKNLTARYCLSHRRLNDNKNPEGVVCP